ncbi:DEAD/DEAH box helicase family protein [Campylobacter sp. RM9344]|uniref:DEAD/DEAH box helicase family protein n=1 Tax=Campylobacter californiensis TaxID=1032243 RepID=A0AAW3ZZD6_9BACT|nr:MULTISPECIES: DEAD/DEAH box helicase family protein [unclassified Campylobacter]MBE2985456.1 DEAD/DEAH box helicase family protein [Campylobacter sp. RM6883]MBE2996024.1 DEAD/DEAH box helicase family protein [Campylobacter sp. RM6913]MBE3030321.1 DEAD/DEAH box helicase family protein [Campylobacter sp. RM9344]MBE3608865.1 DEAD/DEAH box helicase family protein [Campylobacter sp. RM9337]QCD51349.1 type I restriction/modification system, R subunit [Campylobacter sp. RM6914]
MTEEEIKLRFITPAIEKMGWDRNTQISMEYKITDGRINLKQNHIKRSEFKKADYLLSYKPNLPLAIIEAKDETHNIRDGIEQAKNYAQMLDVPFAYSSNGSGFIELDLINGTQRQISLDEFPSPSCLWQRYLGYKNLSQKELEIIQEPYFYAQGSKSPRYYQQVAINRAVEAVATGKNRLMLVMATGTGKTYVAFQIIHRLYKSGAKKKILFLADRNILVDQSRDGDFVPFGNKMTKVENRHLDSAYEIYLSLYQQLVGDDESEPFREFSPDFFDLIVIDECHRGSAKEDSQWRKILEYFNSATHIGMTATPKEDKEVSNISYFGEPIYTYSLNQGIDDGFLAPFRVVRIGIDVDLFELRLPKEIFDEYGNEIEDRVYNIKDYDRNIVLTKRTELVAKRITEFLKQNDRFAKTIVFCVDIEHAGRMCEALRNENSDLVAQNADYIVQMTGDITTTPASLEKFIDIDTIYPVIAVTSKLLTTGVDCKTCKVIAIDSNIGSITEFRQIIGRGTRLREDVGKTHFTILDFRGVSRLFAKAEFDGNPVNEQDIRPKENLPAFEKPKEPKNDTPKEPIKKVIIKGVEATIINEQVQIFDENGKLITINLTDFSKQNTKQEFESLEKFINYWNKNDRKNAVINELLNKGILIDELKNQQKFKEMDEFDLICHIAFDAPPRTRRERVENVKKQDFLSKYQNKAREILTILLEKYANSGIGEIENTKILENDPFRNYGGVSEIIDIFGGKDSYLKAIKELEYEIYAA